MQTNSMFRLLILLLLLPIFLNATMLLSAMAQDGEVILEDPALLGSSIEEQTGKSTSELQKTAVATTAQKVEPTTVPVTQATTDPATAQATEPPPTSTEKPASDPTKAPTSEATTQPTVEPTTEPTQDPTTQPTQDPVVTPTTAPTTEPTTEPTTAPTASYDIDMTAPTGWYRNYVTMECTIHDVGGTGWQNVAITMDGKSLIDGALSSGHLWIDLKQNCTVEVCITDPYGQTHNESVRVLCFDQTAPFLKASVQGDKLHIETSDAHSGISAVQVNGSTYTSIPDGKLDIPLSQYADAYEQLLVQAVDKVGNVSKAIAVANPFFHNEPTSAPVITAAPSNNNNGNSGSNNGSGHNNSSSSGSHSSSATATPAPTATVMPTYMPTFAPTYIPMASPLATFAPMMPQIQTGSPFTSNGNMVTRDLLYDQYTNKQFIAIETKNGDVFYMVIDYDKPLDEDGNQYETYFLNLVDSRDLLDIIDPDEIPEEPEVIYLTPEPTVMPTTAPVQATSSDNTGTMIGMFGLLIAAVSAGGFLYIKKKEVTQHKPLYDKDYDEDDEEEEEVNEDE